MIEIKSKRTANIMVQKRKKLMKYSVTIFYYKRIYKEYIYTIYC
jgi:hypothetical protein